MLPHSVAFNAPVTSPAMAYLARALNVTAPVHGLWDFARSLGAPLSLREIGMLERDLDRAAEIAVANPYWNPRPIEKTAIRALLDDAFFGRAPNAAQEAHAWRV
jgi:alcohol dehydrogenase class IV